ncbi:hypothetical protein [Lysinibacillus sp. D3C2_S12]|uniref:hypothetical protein n=1 Tax=Lysinibacillus sp. D3C2_S12 TaxID=2941226 RepID=UPI0020BE09EE|nr:hypothetical protein [Lysinibacillus sp. D3C2_S12]
MENNSIETDVTEQKETTDTKEETSPNAGEETTEQTKPSIEEGTGGTTIDLETLLKELKPQYTTDLVETDNFKLEVSHHITAGDMLVSTLLATNIIVMLLCRLLRGRK